MIVKITILAIINIIIIAILTIINKIVIITVIIFAILTQIIKSCRENNDSDDENIITPTPSAINSLQSNILVHQTHHFLAP